MPFVVADRVQETTATTGAATTLNLAGASPQCQSFVNGIGSGNTCNVCILSGDNTTWEVILNALVTAGTPNTLTISAANVSAGSSGPGVLVSLTGTSTVYVTAPAALLRNVGNPLIVAPPVAASWTQRNFSGSTSLTDVSTGVKLLDTSGATTTNLRAATVAVPSTPYTIDINLGCLGLVAASSTLAMSAGWTDGTKYQLMVPNFTGNAANFGSVSVLTYSNATTFTAVAGSTRYGFISFNNTWLRLADDGTNVTFSISQDGINFISTYTTTKASGYLGSSGYTNIGFAIDGNMGAVGLGQTILQSWRVH